MYVDLYILYVYIIQAVLVTFVFLWRDTMTQTTYKRKYLFGGLVYSFRGWAYNCHGRKHGSTQAGSGAVAKNSYLICKLESEQEYFYWSWHGFFQPRSPPPVPHLLQEGHTSLFFPKQRHELGTNHSNIWALRRKAFSVKPSHTHI